MFRLQRFVTGFEKTIISLETLPRATLKLKYEFLFRCIFRDSRVNQVTLQAAIKLCDTFLSQNPQDNFFNYARAQLAYEKELQNKGKKDFTETKKHLVAAVNGDQVVDKASGEAAYTLSTLFFQEGKMLEGYVWRAKAMILNADKAIQEFLDTGAKGEKEFQADKHFAKNYFDNPDDSKCAEIKKIVLFSVFLIVLWNRKKPFENFAATPMARMFKYANLQEYSVKINHIASEPENFLHALLQSSSPVQSLTVRVLNSMPKIMLETMEYAYRQKIIAANFYADFLHHLLLLTRMEGLKDNARNFVIQEASRQLFLFNLRMLNLGNAFNGVGGYNYFELLNPKHLTLVQLADIPQGAERDYACYQIFKRMAAKRLPHCLYFLTAVNDVKLYDAALFEFFDASKIDINFDMLEAKRNILRNAKAEMDKQPQVASPFWRRVEIEFKLAIHPLIEVRAKMYGIMQRYLTYYHVREQRNVGLFAVGGKDRDALKLRAENLCREPIFVGDYRKFLGNANALQELFVKIKQFDSDCRLLSGDQIEQAKADMQTLLLDIQREINHREHATRVLEILGLYELKDEVIKQENSAAYQPIYPIANAEWQYIMVPIAAPLPEGAVPVLTDLPPSYESHGFDNVAPPAANHLHTVTNPLFGAPVPLQNFASPLFFFGTQPPAQPPATFQLDQAPAPGFKGNQL